MSDLAVRPLRFRRMTLAGLASGNFIGLFVIWSFLHPRVEGDTIAVVRGSDAARSCLEHGHLLGCPGVYEFPLFQYLPATVLGAVGFSDPHILRALAILSTVSFAATLLLGWRIVRLRAGAGASAVLVAALAAGPLLWYARSTFGEMLAALLILMFVESVLWRRGAAAIAATLWLAGITKETALPLLLVLAAVALFGSGKPVRLAAVRAQLTGLAVGATLVIATTGAFNLFRFHSVWNKTNLQPLFRVPGLDRRAEIAVGLWTAPNGGLLLFWPLAILLGACALVWGLRRRNADWGWWPAAALVGVAALLTAGFASWYAPFGWWAWGPRLMLPWIPALLVLATVLYPRPARALAAWVGATTSRRAAAGVVVAAAALPHLAALRPPDPLLRLFTPDRVCPVPVIIQQVSADYAYRCLRHVAWLKTPPVLLDALHGVTSPNGVAFTLLLVLSCVASLLLAPLAHGARRQTDLDTAGADLPVRKA